jgi:hypothetical protein
MRTIRPFPYLLTPLFLVGACAEAGDTCERPLPVADSVGADPAPSAPAAVVLESARTASAEAADPRGHRPAQRRDRHAAGRPRAPRMVDGGRRALGRGPRGPLPRPPGPHVRRDRERGARMGARRGPRADGPHRAGRVRRPHDRPVDLGGTRHASPARRGPARHPAHVRDDHRRGDGRARRDLVRRPLPEEACEAPGRGGDAPGGTAIAPGARPCPTASVAAHRSPAADDAPRGAGTSTGRSGRPPTSSRPGT